MEPTITITAVRKYFGQSVATIDIPRDELRARLKDGDSLMDIVEELYYNDDYSDIDESDNDPYVNNELEIESVKGNPATPEQVQAELP